MLRASRHDMKEALARDEQQTGGEEADCVPKTYSGPGAATREWLAQCACGVDVIDSAVEVAFEGRFVIGSRWVDDCSEGARSWGTCFFGVDGYGSEQVGLLEWQQAAGRWGCAQAVARKASRVVLRNLRVEQLDRRSGHAWGVFSWTEPTEVGGSA